MALINANGRGVIEARLWLPRTGAWQADLVVDSPDAITGEVKISVNDGQAAFVGTVWRGAEYLDKALIKVVAGADGLRRIAKAKHYAQTSLRIVFGDLLAQAGEKLSPTADAATLGRQLAAWTTAALPIGRVLSLALGSAAPGATWRALPDGTIWVGPEIWPDSGLAVGDYQILEENPRQISAVLGVEAPLLLPGTTLAGRRVSYLEHTVNADGVRSLVWFEQSTTSTPARDRLKEAFGSAVRSFAPVDYYACYWARVISQSGGLIDVEIENPTVAKFMPTMAQVPLTMPAPGATMQMAATGRVLVGWSGGDPSKPYAFAPDANTHAQKLVLNADHIVLGGESGAELAIKGESYRKAEDIYLKAISTAAAAALGALGLTVPATALSTADSVWAGAAAAFLASKTKVS